MAKTVWDHVDAEEWPMIPKQVMEDRRPKPDVPGAPGLPMVTIQNNHFHMPSGRQEAMITITPQGTVLLENLFVTDIRYARYLVPLIDLMSWGERMWRWLRARLV